MKLGDVVVDGFSFSPRMAPGRYIMTGLNQYGQIVVEEIDVRWPLSSQTKRYLALKRKQHKRPFIPRLRCQRSSRRMAVLAKRKRLGLPPDGKIPGYDRTLSYLAASVFGREATTQLTGYQWQA